MSLQLWLPLNGNTNNQGLSNISMSGTANYSDGILGKCATFSGSVANIIYNNTTAFNYTDNFSWCVWVKTNYTGTAGQYAFTVGRADAGGFGYGLQCTSTTSCNVRFGNSAYGVSVTGGQWTHLAFTKQGSIIKIYKNGTPINTITFSGTIPTYSDGNGLGLGCFHYTGDIYAFYGSLCDFRIYDHVLSAKEVKEISKGLAIHLPLSWGGNPNLFKNSLPVFSAYNVNTGVSSVTRIDDTDLGQKALKITVTNSSSSASYPSNGIFITTANSGVVLESGKTYTTSFYAKSDIDNITIAPNITEGRTITSSDLKMTTSWKKCYATFNSTSTGVTTCFYVSVPANTTFSFYIALPKCEEGNRYTPWVPNVSDKEYTTFGFDKGYTDECSGYNRTITTSGTSSTATNSPRGTGNKFVSGTKIITDGFPSGSKQPWTISFWHKSKSGTYSSWSDVCGFDVSPSSATSATTQFRLETTNTSGNNYVWYGNGVVTDSGGCCGSGTVTTETWRFVVLTYDGNIIRHYVNGTQLNTHTVATTYQGFKSYSRFYLGDSGMLSELADCRVYATCLSADDVKELYQTPISIDKSGKLFCNSLVEE